MNDMKEDLDEIFGIPVPEKKTEEHVGAEETAFGDTMNDANGVTFVDQATKLNNSISNTGRSGTKTSRKSSDGKSKIQTPQDGPNADEIIKHSDSRKEEHNALGNSNKQVDNVHEEKVDTTKPAQEISSSHKPHKSVFHGFILDCDDPDLFNFYNIKQDALATWLLPGGTMNFSALTDELRQARPDLSQVVFGDLQSMFLALRHIQKWKDRITCMQVDINQQYYAWKRAVELFRGVLARCKYEKPSERQEGVVMEHMGDMIMYMSKLESLHASSSAVGENLDNAFDCISRQITTSVSTMNKDVDIVERKVNAAQNMASNLSDFDGLSDTMSKNKTKSSAPNRQSEKDSKAGTIDWT